MKKILIGGSPCTFWSIAQSPDKREITASGLGWELFENYVIAKDKFKPDFFLYENNKSASQPIKEQISRELGVPLQYINSNLVSAQNRQRFYCHNFGNVPLPPDRGILLQDILETGIACQEKSYAYTTRCTGACALDTFQRARHTMVAEPVILQLPHGYNEGGVKYGKSPTVTASKFEHNNFVLVNIEDCETLKKAIPDLIEKYGYLPEKFNAYNRSVITDKSPTLSTGSMVTSSCATLIFEQAKHCERAVARFDDGRKYPIYPVKDGIITIDNHEFPVKLPNGFYILRKLSVTEAERLQTLPDGYTSVLSDAQAYKAIGNGWTAEVIIWLLEHGLKGVPRDEELVVLSLYDGIGTGRYCLEKLGFTNVKYYAYEIDKYPIMAALANYPDIIECGDAFQVRDDNWCIGGVSCV